MTRDSNLSDKTHLPVPMDDGATRHLVGARMSAAALQATSGEMIDLSALPGRTIVYAYPRTSSPGGQVSVGWDAVPGDRGCTAESCAFRDHFSELKRLGIDSVFGLSVQDSAYQREAVERLHLPFALLSDEILRLTRLMNFPTFEYAGARLLNRFTLVIDNETLRHVFYPGYPPPIIMQKSSPSGSLKKPS